MSKKKKKPAGFVFTSANSSPFRDTYHWFLTASWPVFFAAMVFVFITTNFFFTLLYYFCGGLSSTSHFWGYFFFSVHTIATVGYGNIFPVSPLAQILVTAEIMTGLFLIALMTGLVFSKFSRPTAKVLFSEVAVVSQRNGVPSFNFRMANSRGVHIAEAQVKVSVVKEYTTAEGEFMRKLYDLNLERSNSPMFIISWSVFHPVTEDSPLYDLIFGDRKEEDFRIVVSLTGYEPVLGQTIHSRYMYGPNDIHVGKTFKDAVKREGDLITLDYSVFHDVVDLNSSV